jgi:hypothetical protein
MQPFGLLLPVFALAKYRVRDAPLTRISLHSAGNFLQREWAALRAARVVCPVVAGGIVFCKIW